MSNLENLKACHPNAAILDGYRIVGNEDTVKALCPSCEEWNTHGYSGEVFHRVSHCGKRCPAGYIIQVKGSIAPEKACRINEPSNTNITADSKFNCLKQFCREVINSRFVQLFDPYEQDIKKAIDIEDVLLLGIHNIEGENIHGVWSYAQFRLFIFWRIGHTQPILLVSQEHLAAALLTFAPKWFWQQRYGQRWADEGAKQVHLSLRNRLFRRGDRKIMHGMLEDFIMPKLGMPATYLDPNYFPHAGLAICDWED